MVRLSDCEHDGRTEIHHHHPTQQPPQQQLEAQPAPEGAANTPALVANAYRASKLLLDADRLTAAAEAGYSVGAGARFPTFVHT